LAAIIGGVGSLAIATPSQAAPPCAVNYDVQVFGNVETPYAQVNASITNTGSTTYGHWSVYLLTPLGTTVQEWGVTPLPRRGWYEGALYHALLGPGDIASFGFLLRLPPGSLDSSLIAIACSV